MRPFFQTLTAIYLCCFSYCLAYSAEDNTQKKVAQVLVVEGKVTAYLTDSDRHDLTRGNDLFEDEWLEIGPGGRADISVIDGSVLSFIENSKYHFVNIETDPDHPENYKNVATITQGGLKVLSGKLSKANPAGYTLQTPVTTIGIRGTEFMVTIPQENTVHAYVQHGSISATSSYAAFVSGDHVSKVSKELVTVLNEGDAIQATPRTVSNIKPEKIFGYDGLAPRTLDTGSIGPIKSTSSSSSESPKKDSKQHPIQNTGSKNSSNGPPPSKAPESGFCHSL